MTLIDKLRILQKHPRPPSLTCRRCPVAPDVARCRQFSFHLSSRVCGRHRLISCYSLHVKNSINIPLKRTRWRATSRTEIIYYSSCDGWHTSLWTLFVAQWQLRKFSILSEEKITTTISMFVFLWFPLSYDLDSWNFMRHCSSLSQFFCFFIWRHLPRLFPHFTAFDRLSFL